MFFEGIYVDSDEALKIRLSNALSRNEIIEENGINRDYFFLFLVFSETRISLFLIFSKNKR